MLYINTFLLEEDTDFYPEPEGYEVTYLLLLSSRAGVPSLWDLMPDDLSGN